MPNEFFCSRCNYMNPEGSAYCCMCGQNLEKERARVREEQLAGLAPIVERQFVGEFGERKVQVYCRDILSLEEHVDVLTVSAFPYDYLPVPRTIIGALQLNRGICVEDLSRTPFIDLRERIGCWLSDDLGESRDEGWDGAGRIGCVELPTMASTKRVMDAGGPGSGEGDAALSSVRAYFHMLGIAAEAGVPVSTVAMPVLGAGCQGLDYKMVAVPLVSEAVEFLARTPRTQKVIFVERSPEKALMLAEAVERSYRIAEMGLAAAGPHGRGQNDMPMVFVSYSSKDDSAAQLLCDSLGKHGIRYWYAPHDIRTGEYARKIVDAINDSTHFVCLVTENSMGSEHVLNEIDLAFSHLRDGIRLIPLRLDGHEGIESASPEFRYYLGRMNWSSCRLPVDAGQMDGFVDRIFGPAS